MRAFQCRPNKGRLFFVFQFTRNFFMGRDRGDAAAFRVGCPPVTCGKGTYEKKTRIPFSDPADYFVTVPNSGFCSRVHRVGITPVTDPNLWTTRLTASGQTYSYRPPTAAGRQLYCMDLGYSYRYGTESFLKSYTYRSATGTDADALWSEMVAKTGLGEMDAATQGNVKWMMSYIADYTGEIPGSLFMALQTYIWDNQSDKSAGGDPSGDIDAGGFANQDTYDQYVGYYNWLLGQKANEDAELQAQVEEYAEQGIQASIVEDNSSKWAVLATSSVSGRQAFAAYHSTRKVITNDNPQPGDPDDPPVAGMATSPLRRCRQGTDRGLDGAVYNIYRDGQIVGSDCDVHGGIIEVNNVTKGLWTFVEREAPEGFALDPTPPQCLCGCHRWEQAVYGHSGG